MRTVRLTAVLAGVLITAYQYSPSAFSRLGIAGALAFLFGSAVSGMATYDESNLYLGPKGSYIESLAHGDVNGDGEDWDEDLSEVRRGICWLTPATPAARSRSSLRHRRRRRRVGADSRARVYRRVCHPQEGCGARRIGVASIR